MSWSMPPTGHWNPGLPMSSNMNMGYTPEQWALMQQQNWQQWTQWQQQYAQWQSQYGEKYAEQMPAMGMVPPLPPMSCAPPPAPPPPDKPPPPHENDQPLYSQQKPPPPVPAPTQVPKNSEKMNSTITSGNTLNWSHATDIRKDISQNSACNDISQNSAHNDVSQNFEALKKLSEEERLFDSQFQKWEEEIEKWKKENVNHPDKQAYSEYEQKFEACRAQLLERRQQMKQKRARLTNSNTSTANSSVIGNTGHIMVQPPLPTTNINYSSNNLQSQNLSNNKSSDLITPSNVATSSNQTFTNYPYNNQSRYGNENKLNQQYSSEPIQNVDPYSYGTTNKTEFLPTKEPLKGIPGLDLVPETEKMLGHNKPQDVIDITVDKFSDGQTNNLTGPDYSTISKGINNILGDEKIMNILSMVRDQKSFDTANVRKLSNNANIMNDKQQLNTAHQSVRPTASYNTFSSGDLPRHPALEASVHPIARPYDSGQNEILKDQNYANYSATTDQNAAIRNVSQVGQSLLNQSMQKTFDTFPKDNQERRNFVDQPMCPVPAQPVRSKWIEEPIFTPSIIVEYEHKSLRLKARDFIEPVHVFDYNHKSKESDHRKKDFEREVDDLFYRQPRKKETNDDNFAPERLYHEPYHRDVERKPKDNVKEDFRQRGSLREEYDERRRYDDKYDDRKRDDSDKYRRREDVYRDREKDWDRGRDREEYRDKYRDYRRDDNRNRSRSRERESRKRAHSKESDEREINTSKNKKANPNNEVTQAQHYVMIDDLLEPPGREMRPDKIVIILRGLPGSGKSYLAKLIRDKEAEHGGTVRIMSIDDYFMQEGEIESNDPITGKVIKKPSLKYEYDQGLEESYLNSLKRAFKRSLTDGYFTFLIYDAVNEQLKSYADVWNFARQNGFQVYICTMEADVATCHRRNIHNRTLEEIEAIKSRFFSTPAHHIQLDPTTLLQSAAITEVQMEDADDAVTMVDAMDTENTPRQVENHFTSKWEKMDDAVQLARLDGTSKPLRPSQLSMEDYLQIDEWKPNVAKPGKKTVRWADIEERRQQEKMRAIGFVVGQTDWNRMTDPTMGSSALTQTKYIERVRRM